MYADAPVHQYTCSVYFFLFGITCTVTFPLICWGVYTQIHPKINLPVYLHASPLLDNKDLPVTATTCVSALKCNHSWPYLFISYFYSIRLKAKICPSTFLLLYMSTDISVHHYTCTVYFFLFGITGTVTFPLIC